MLNADSPCGWGAWRRLRRSRRMVWGSFTWRQVRRTTRQPAAWRRRSRARSASKATRVRCAPAPSSSTIRRWLDHMQSASILQPSRSRTALSCGRGRSELASRAAKRVSSLLRTPPRGPAVRRLTQSRSFAVPRRPRWRSRSASSSSSCRRWRYSASRIAPSSPSCVSTFARSRIVRGSVVTGIRRLLVISSGGRRRRRRRIAGQDRVDRSTATSTCRCPPSRMTPQSAAAERWLRTAPSPHRITAASHRPSRGMTRWPTA
jgi:hypothetical protein